MTLTPEKRIYNSETASLIGEDAGTYIDNYHQLLEQKIIRQMEVARSHFGRAVYAWALQKKAIAKSEVDAALQVVSEAFWWADETELEEEPHSLLHQIAKWKHDAIGCHLIRDGDQYLQRCKVALTHKRIGFSAGLTSTPVCTLCGESEFDCEHSRERLYWIRGGEDKDGRCNICYEIKCSEHSDKYIYKSRPVMKISNAALHEVSIVRRPKMPMARLQEVSIHKNEIERNNGKIDESKGMVYACHVCDGICHGFDE